MDATEDSEWNDAQRLHNGLASVAEERARALQAAEHEAQELLQQIDEADAAVFKDRVVAGNVEPEEFKDEEEEAVFEQYRQQRLQELRQQQKEERFGSIIHISAAQFVREVTEASAQHTVVVHMFKPGLEICEKLQAAFGELAAKFASVKFVSIIYNNCIPDYPDSALPCVLVYTNSDLARQIVGVQEYGGELFRACDVEYVLGECGALKSQLSSDPRMDHIKRMLKSVPLAGDSSDDD